MTGIEALRDWVRRIGDRKYMTNEWLKADDMDLYVRKGYHACGFCLDLATINVFDKGKGTFTKLLEAAHAMNPWDATFVESVADKRLADFLQRKGFLTYDNGGSDCFYLPKEKQ